VDYLSFRVFLRATSRTYINLKKSRFDELELILGLFRTEDLLYLKNQSLLRQVRGIFNGCSQI